MITFRYRSLSPLKPETSTSRKAQERGNSEYLRATKMRNRADKAPSEASFKGTEYLTIDLSKGAPVLSTQESISLQFKTRQPNGLLFYSGEQDDYLTVSLKDGGASVGMTLAKGRLDLHIKPARIRFDDNQWHKIIVHRKVQEISSITSFCRLSAIVDGIYAEHGHTAGSFTHLASDLLLVGGGADARSLQGAKGINNFVGCLRKVEFAAEGVKMELIEATRSGAAGAAAWGKIDFHCREPRASDPITFTTRDSHLELRNVLVTIANPRGLSTLVSRLMRARGFGGKGSACSGTEYAFPRAEGTFPPAATRLRA
ncbi:hypothetical protein KM043_010353 [Ampulex compressa]|nr:hypothetical protein KM043_010353 [Ampulex compressa]